MAGKLDWYGPQAVRWIEAEQGRRLSRCALLVANRAKRLLSVDGTAKGTGRAGKGRFRKHLRYNASPSAPGEPPHVQTGRLRASVAWELVALVARVGTNVLHGKALQTGTRKMKARPWLDRALRLEQDEIRRILGAPMRDPK